MADMSETRPLLPAAAAGAKRSSGALTMGFALMVGLACVAAIVGGGAAVHSHRAAAAATSASSAALG
jgi:hypothetical protein